MNKESILRRYPVIHRLHWMIILVFILYNTSSNAQNYLLNSKCFTESDGLSHDFITALHQDQDGFMWLGTKFGLNRYDGFNFKWFTKKTHNFESNSIGSIHQGENGLLWVVSKEKVKETEIYTEINLLHSRSYKSTSLEEKFSGEMPFKLRDIQSLHALSDGRMILSLHGQQYFLYSENTGFTSLSLPYDFKIFNTTSDTSLLGTSCGKFIKIDLEGKSSWSYTFRESQKGIDIQEDHLGQLYMVTAEATIKNGYECFINGEVSTFDNGSNKTRIILFPEFIPKAYRMTVDKINGNAWMIYDTTIYLANINKLLYQESSLLKIERNKQYYNLMVDKSGLLWYGNIYGVCIVEVKPSKFQQYLKSATQIRHSVRGMGMLDDLLIVNSSLGGTELNINTGEYNSPEERKKHFGSKKCFPMFTSDSGEIWTANNKLFKLDSIGLIEKEYDLNELTNNERTKIWSVFMDSSKTIWLGIGSGLIYTLRPNKNSILQGFEKFNASPKNKIGVIWHFHENKRGLWLATDNGLYLLDPNTGIKAIYGQKQVEPYYLPAKGYHFIHEDQEGIFWLATTEMGLVRFDPKHDVNDIAPSFLQYSRIDGLPSNELYAIYEDDFDNLWISSANGLIQFKKEDFSFRVYSQEQGITNDEFNRLAYYRSDSGIIFFGGLNGITAFDPDDFQQTEEEIELMISSIFVFRGDEGIKTEMTQYGLDGHPINFYPEDKFISIELGTLEYLYPDKVKYSYKILGMHTNWIELESNKIQLSGLPYGRQQLVFKGERPGSKDTKFDLKVVLIVLKPFYLRVWFILPVIVILLVIIWQYILWRTQSLKNQKNHLEKMVKDRTQNIEMDKLLIEKQTDLLKELDKAKTRFFNNISHELRTPLTVISGLINEIRGNDKAKKLIKRNSDNLLDLVNQILELRRLESGKQNLHLIQADVISYLRYICESFHPMLSKMGIELVLESKLADFVMDYDPEKLLRIMSNLVSNAIKFSPDGGIIQVVIEINQGIENLEQSRLYVSVIDNGIGIPINQLPYIFDLFYMVDSDKYQRKRIDLGGSGIGLSLIKELIDLKGGEIDVKSEEGKGAKFRFWLPITNNAKRDKVDTTKILDKNILDAPSSVNDNNSQSRSKDLGTNEELNIVSDKPILLIVEDSVDITQYLTICLEDRYKLIYASDGSMGVNLAISEVPDLIVSDVMMPKKDGFELCRILKTDERTSHIPIVLLTARTDEASRISGFEHGADAYLSKPFNRKELDIRLQKLYELRMLLQSRYSGLETSHISDNPSSQLEDSFILRIISIVHDHLEDEQFGILKLCEVAGLSRTQLHNKIKSLTGRSTSHYIRTIRLKHSCELMKQKDLNISEIAYSVGFSNLQYFSKVFSMEFGCSPTKFRKKNGI